MFIVFLIGNTNFKQDGTTQLLSRRILPTKDPKLPDSQYNALYCFYNATNGKSWIWPGASVNSKPWDFNEPNANPCYDDWQGISCLCDTTTMLCNLIDLVLSRHNLSGTMPTCINSWVGLETIDLSTNNITGTIPTNISSWSRIKTIFFQGNQLNGMIPEAIGQFSELIHVDFDNNELTMIPDALYNATGLISLQISNNRLQGTISQQIGQLKKLEQLLLQNNYLESSIPSSIGKAVALKMIDLSSNRLKGTLPFSIGNLANVTSLRLNDNQLTGIIPSSIGNLTSLTELYFYSNQLWGKIPETIGNLKKLIILDLFDNFLSGGFPSTFDTCTLLTDLYIDYNLMTGPISVLKSMERLAIVYLGVNFFSGQAASSLESLSKMIDLQINQNQFSGLIPTSALWTALYEYQAGNNYFTSSLPSSINNFATSLYYFWVGDNYLTGTIPEYFFSGLLALTNFNVSSNLLTGTIPNNVSKSSVLNQLVLDQNFLTGTLPASLSNLLSVYVISLHDNELTGAIPSDYHRLLLLDEFFVQRNKLTGPMHVILNASIPKTVLNLDLSENYFTGSIPSIFFAHNVELETFAVVGNCLTGSIPAAICDCQFLTALSLDGMSTAESCRNYIFPGFPWFNGFSLRQYITGGIPLCLFSMARIESLHLSGNGFTGSIPNNLTISDSLVDLELSHNILTGTIPLYLQQKAWLNLDLSYNKLSGTLSNDFVPVPNNGSLYLQVNRLSGEVPSQLLTIQNINILEGNIFECDSPERDLPGNDPNNDSYSCGSNTVNDILYSWIAFCCCILMMIVIVYYCFHKKDEETGRRTSFFSHSVHSRKLSKANTHHRPTFNPSIISFTPSFVSERGSKDNQFPIQREGTMGLDEKPHSSSSGRALRSGSDQPSNQHGGFFAIFQDMLDLLKEWSAALDDFIQDHPNSNIGLLATFLHEIRQAFVLLTGFTLLICMPVYGVTKIYNKSYDEEYAWEISGLLFSGEIPALILFGVFTIFASLVFLLLKQVFANTSRVKFLFLFSPFSSRVNSRTSDIEASPSAAAIAIVAGKAGVRGSEINNPQRESMINPAIDYQSLVPLSPIHLQISRNQMRYSQVYLVHGIVATVNTFLLGTVDFLYVYTVIQSTSAVITCAAIALAIFRLYTNNILLWKAIPYTAKMVVSSGHWMENVIAACSVSVGICKKADRAPSRATNTKSKGGTSTGTTPGTLNPLAVQNSSIISDHTCDSNASTVSFQSTMVLAKNSRFSDASNPLSETSSSDNKNIKNTLPDNFWEIPYLFTTKDISFLERLMLFNNLIIPAIAILIILPDCFYNALFAADNVTSSYQYYSCAEYYYFGDIGYYCKLPTEQTSYSPPFIYSYQCSSKIVINYVPVYIMMFIFVGIILPLKNITFKMAYEHYYDLVHSSPSSVTSSGQSSSSSHCSSRICCGKNGDGCVCCSQREWFTNKQMFALFNFALPENLKRLKASKDVHQPMLFAKLKLTTQLSSYLAITIAIGCLFPPVAVIACITVITITYYEEFIIGRLLYESSRLGYLWYSEKLEEDCTGITESLNLSLRSTLVVSCGLFGYILFDTWGDQEGWESALPITLVMGIFPLIIGFVYQSYRGIVLNREKILALLHVQSKKTAGIEEQKSFNNGDENYQTKTQEGSGRGSGGGNGSKADENGKAIASDPEEFSITAGGGEALILADEQEIDEGGMLRRSSLIEMHSSSHPPRDP